MKTFIDLCIEGKKKSEDIDDFIDDWHEGNLEKELDDLPLNEALGMSLDEFFNFLEHPFYIEELISQRRIVFIIEGAKQDAASMDC